MLNSSISSENELLDKRLEKKNKVQSFCSRYRRNKTVCPRFGLFSYKTGGLFNDGLLQYMPPFAIIMSLVVILILVFELVYLLSKYNTIDSVNNSEGTLKDDFSLPDIYNFTQ